MTPGRDLDQLLPSSTQVKNEYSHTSTPHMPSWHGEGHLEVFTCHILQHRSPLPQTTPPQLYLFQTLSVPFAVPEPLLAPSCPNICDVYFSKPQYVYQTARRHIPQAICLGKHALQCLLHKPKSQ